MEQEKRSVDQNAEQHAKKGTGLKEVPKRSFFGPKGLPIRNGRRNVDVLIKYWKGDDQRCKGRRTEKRGGHKSLEGEEKRW